MRDNWLGNQIFQSYADSLEHVCEAWTKLIVQPWRIMSIGMRPWVLINEDWYEMGSRFDVCR